MNTLKPVSLHRQGIQRKLALALGIDLSLEQYLFAMISMSCGIYYQTLLGTVPCLMALLAHEHLELHSKDTTQLK